MTDIVPTIGRIVWYALANFDVELIRQRRGIGTTNCPGNIVAVGDIYAAQIVAVWGDKPDSYVNLKVALDGPDTHWATSRRVGEGPGTYQWMPYQKGQAAKTEAADAKAAPPPPAAEPPPTPVDVVADMESLIQLTAAANGYDAYGRYVFDDAHLFRRGGKFVRVSVRAV